MKSNPMGIIAYQIYLLIVNQVNYLGVLLCRWVHPPTTQLEEEDASTCSKIRVGGCILGVRMQPQTKKIFFDYVDASASSNSRVGGCIH